MYAVLSDIHANFAALEAVERDARSLAADADEDLAFLCLGDVVDYGPQPNECVAWMRRHTATVVVGNHDQAAITDDPPIDIDSKLWPILLWSREELHAEHKAAIATWPVVANLGPFTLFHSNRIDHNGYIDNPRSALDNLVQLPTIYGLFGHTHIACSYIHALPQPRLSLISSDPIDLRMHAATALATDQWHDLPSGRRRVLLNPGAVGQPRHHALLMAAGLGRDSRASYLLLRQVAHDRWQFCYRRVEYDVEGTVSLLRALRWNGGPAQPTDTHPFAQRLAAVRSNMDHALPATVELLVAQLRS